MSGRGQDSKFWSSAADIPNSANRRRALIAGQVLQLLGTAAEWEGSIPDLLDAYCAQGRSPAPSDAAELARILTSYKALFYRRGFTSTPRVLAANGRVRFERVSKRKATSRPRR